MININNLSMGFTNRTLFKDVSFSIFPGEKIGLTGPNGAGKTTLFSIILGEMEPVAGNVSVQKNLNIGFLPQESKFQSTRTVMDEITSGDMRIQKLLDEKHKLEEESKADSNRYGDVLHELEQLGIYELEHKAEKILAGLGFKDEDIHRPINNLSGGWQMRTLLAKLLTYTYDLLLLDEPTNYLDLHATLWLKEYLKNYPGAFILISHDRVFLNEVTNYTIILEHSKMTKLKGNYETYELQKNIQLTHLERQQKVVEKKRDQLERFAERFHAQPNKASAVRNKRRQLEKLPDIELPVAQSSLEGFDFAQVPQSGYLVVRADKVSKSYDEKKVYIDLEYEITRGQKVCLVGPNGAGKSTLLKMLAGVVAPDNGTVKYGHNVTHGYFSQSRTDVLNVERTALEEAYASAPGGTQTTRVRSLLGLFSFHGDDVFKQVKVLSGGEKSRLILAKLLINPPNFMLLDEPTTHLDLDGVKALTNAVKSYEGTICFISHDLFFIKEIADTVVEVDSGKIRVYPGGLDYYLEKRQEKDAELKDQKRQEKLEQEQKKKKEQNKEDESNPHLRAIKEQHNQALKRLVDIKKQIKDMEKETQDLETESYVKSRLLTKMYESKDGEQIKEIGQRLKYIQTRLREIESTIKLMKEERDRISK